MKSGAFLDTASHMQGKEEKESLVNQSTTDSHPGRNENSSATPLCATSNREALSQLSGFCVTSTLLSRWRQINGKIDVRHVILTELVLVDCWSTSLVIFRYFRAPVICPCFFLFVGVCWVCHLYKYPWLR